MDFILVHRIRGRVASRVVEDIARETARRARLRHEIERLFSCLTPIQVKALIAYFQLGYLYDMSNEEVEKLLSEKSPRSVAQIRRWALVTLHKAVDAKTLIQPTFV